uniref:Uncharacterized protein n=1 Tax=Ditylenchus dipsaci TaxID=166011 RepID=A0A915E5A2_9BILA
MDSLCSLLLPKKESSAPPPVSLADALEDVERKKMYSNFQDYLDARKEAKKKELYWFSAGFFLFFEVCISGFLFFASENSWEVRMICMSVPAPVLCMFGMALKKRQLWWPQLVLNVVFTALADLALIVAIVLVITNLHPTGRMLTTMTTDPEC